MNAERSTSDLPKVYVVTERRTRSQFVGRTGWLDKFSKKALGKFPCPLQSRIRQNGVNRFTLSILHEAENIEEAAFAESFYIALLTPRFNQASAG